MDLSRGICILCTNNSKVVYPAQSKNITSLLCDLLKKSIDIHKFQETSSTLKVCPFCLYDILQVSQHRQTLDKFYEDADCCSICQGEDNLICVTDWTYFEILLKNIGAQKTTRKCSICLHCVKILKLLDQMKVNFLKKYPQLGLTEQGKNRERYEKNCTKDRSTPETNRKRVSSAALSNSDFDGEPLRKNRHINDFKGALKHLKPLKYSNFNIDHCNGDKKLLRQVAFVKLSISKDQTKQPVSGDNETSKVTSPRQSFFKIRLKLNANRTKAPKIISAKIKKPKEKSKYISSSKKELMVRIVKMDLNKMQQERLNSDSDHDAPLPRTPTKGSRKMMPEEPMSSSRKRKSVTFADNLNVEIVEGVSSLKDNTNGSPLKSLLKRSNSPTSEILGNGTAENSSEDYPGMVSTNIQDINSDTKDSDDDFDVSKSYVEDIQKHNESIFNSLKHSVENPEDAEKTHKSNKIDPKDAEIDHVSAKSYSKKSRITGNTSSDSEDDEEKISDKENDTRSGTTDNDAENKEDGDSDEKMSNSDIDEGEYPKLASTDLVNGIDSKKEDDVVVSNKDSNERRLNKKQDENEIDSSVTVPLHSSNEDRLITSGDNIDRFPTPNSSALDLSPARSGGSKILNINGGYNENSVERINTSKSYTHSIEAIEKKNKNYSISRGECDDLNQLETGTNDSSLGKDSFHSPETPASHKNHISELNINNDKTVSDSQNVELSESEKVSCMTDTLGETDNEANKTASISSPVDGQTEGSITLNNDIQRGDNIGPDVLTVGKFSDNLTTLDENTDSSSDKILGSQVN